MIREQFNTPNYCAYVMVFAPGCPHAICDYKIQQVVRNTDDDLERKNRQIVEDVEGHRDKTGLEYRVCLPGDHKNPVWWEHTRRVDIA
jgi:hypothetical protein